ncbi:MAG: HAD hydrolase-like protein [Bacteroidota bacterium]
MIDLKKYTHIIWDWNGTLLDDSWLCVDVMNGMLKEQNLPPVTLEIYKELFDFPVRDYYLKLGWDFDKEPFEMVGMKFINRYNNRQGQTRLHGESKHVLERFAVAGYSQNILSAREVQKLIAETRLLGIHHFFDRIIGLQDHYAHSKTEVGSSFVNEISVPKGKILMIGDTIHDADVANEIGIDCVLIPNGHNSASRLEKLKTVQISSLAELGELASMLALRYTP